MNECIFCKIVKGQLPNYTVLENPDFLAFLDINPKSTAQTLVIPKKHITSNFGAASREDVQDLIGFAHEVVSKIQAKLENVERCQIAIEGFEIDHLHIKIYPAYLPEPTKDALHIGGNPASKEELEELSRLLA